MTPQRIGRTGATALVTVMAFTIAPCTFACGQVRAERISKVEEFPYVFYTVVTDCSEKSADITYQTGRGEGNDVEGDMRLRRASRVFHWNLDQMSRAAPTRLRLQTWGATMASR